MRGFRSQAEYDNASYSSPINVPHRAVHFPPAMHARIACVAAHALARAGQAPLHLPYISPAHALARAGQRQGHG